MVTLITFGGAGSGKSCVCNFLNCGKSTGPFISGSSAESGLTSAITWTEGPAFGDPDLPNLRIFDLPGTGDLNISIKDLAL